MAFFQLPPDRLTSGGFWKKAPETDDTNDSEGFLHPYPFRYSSRGSIYFLSEMS